MRYAIETFDGKTFTELMRCRTQDEVARWALEQQLPLIDVYRLLPDGKHLVYTLSYADGKLRRSNV